MRSCGLLTKDINKMDKLRKQLYDLKINILKSVAIIDTRLNLAEEVLDAEIELEQLRIAFVSKSVAKKYAEFCVECDRKGLPLLLIDDYIEQYCC